MSEMHETLITRGDVRGYSFDKKVQIFVPWNVTLLHQQCHQLAQAYDRAKRICTRSLIRQYGFKNIDKWLDDLSFIDMTLATDIGKYELYKIGELK